jgi:SAM-dependent methyltransferase
MSRTATRLFDAMAPAYEVLEPWYEHLYAVVHAILRRAVGPAPAAGARALDAGCGTGFQTRLLGELGWRAHGVDLSGGLLAVARRRLPTARLARGTVEALPYADASFDVVVCCGSTLSFVDDPARALGEMARVLRPGGRLLLECEHRPSLDLAWALGSALLGDGLGYGVSPREVWRAIRARDAAWLPYPGYGRLRLFTARELRALLGAAGLTPRQAWGIHALTNVLPSTVLHHPRLPRSLGALYRALCRMDAALAATAPVRGLANSLVVLAVRAQPSA